MYLREHTISEKDCLTCQQQRQYTIPPPDMTSNTTDPYFSRAEPWMFFDDAVEIVKPPENNNTTSSNSQGVQGVLQEVVVKKEEVTKLKTVPTPFRKNVFPSSSSTSAPSITFIMTGRGSSSSATFPQGDCAHVERRDALARCVASTVLQKGAENVHLGIVFEDLVSFRLDKSAGQHVVNPTETEIIGLFRQIAAGRLSKYYHAAPNAKGNLQDYNDNMKNLDLIKARLLFTDFIEKIVKDKTEYANTAFVILHEKYNIFPPFYEQALQKSSGKKLQHIFFLCGGVDDWQVHMVKGARLAMQKIGVKVLDASLGLQAEFTSKIFHIILSHQAANVLVSSLKPVLANASNSAKPFIDSTRQGKGKDVKKQGNLQFVLFARMASSNLTADVDYRPALYGMCRVIVYTLWRSHGLNKNIALSLVFKDKVVITLDGAKLYFNANVGKKTGGCAPTERNISRALETFIYEKKFGKKISSAGMSYCKFDEDVELSDVVWKVNPESALACQIVPYSKDRHDIVLNPYDIPKPRAVDRDLLVILQLPESDNNPLAQKLKQLQPIVAALPGPSLSPSACICALGSHHQWGRLHPAILALRTPRRILVNPTKTVAASKQEDEKREEWQQVP